MQQLMAKMAAVTGAPEPKEIPLAAAKLVSAWQTFKYKHLHGPLPKVSSSAIAVMSSGQYLDGSKTAHELGYRPEVSVEEALRRAFAWFSSQGKVNIVSQVPQERSCLSDHCLLQCRRSLGRCPSERHFRNEFLETALESFAMAGVSRRPRP
ncbi:MAG TPA: hypothetical protein VNW97_02500 [Candidatus Saccharimonadales bacterium]|nr:hypothetical protein [Candidatus Saccharimonadales bacterium]